MPFAGRNNFLMLKQLVRVFAVINVKNPKKHVIKGGLPAFSLTLKSWLTPKSWSTPEENVIFLNKDLKLF